MTPRRQHTHRATGDSVVRPYSGPVAVRQVRASHGNVTLVDYCRCGSERRTNSNAGYVERGPWIEADRG